MYFLASLALSIIAIKVTYTISHEMECITNTELVTLPYFQHNLCELFLLLGIMY